MTTAKNDRTVLYANGKYGSVDGTLTDFQGATDYQELSRRIVYAAHLEPTQTFSVGLNPLVAAAGDLFSVLVELSKVNQGDGPEALNNRMTDSVAGFESRAIRAGVDRDDVMVARYLLCTVVDETVMNQKWSNGTAGFWTKNSLLSRFHNETSGGEKFFLLLDQMSVNPVRYLQLLELMYLCLSLGFKGRYVERHDAAEQLRFIRGNLLSLITGLRGAPSGQISPRWQGAESNEEKGVLIIPGWLVGGFAVVILLLIFTFATWMLSEERRTVLQPFEQVDPSAHELQS